MSEIVKASEAVVSLGDLRDLALDAANSRFFGAQTQEQALCLMLAGKDLGFSYMQSLRLFHVISGKPSLSADALVAICKGHPTCEKFHRVSESDTESTWVAKRRGEPEQTSTFTIEDARRAGLLGKKGGNWEMYPKRMLAARAKAFLARDVWPDLVAGIYSPDELAPQRVETEVRTVPESRPTPVSIQDAGESVDESIALGFATEMREAMSLPELTAIGVRISKTDLPSVLKDALRVQHSKAKARVTPPADAGDAWEPARG